VGVWAGSIAADPGSGALWIGTDAGPPVHGARNGR